MKLKGMTGIYSKVIKSGAKWIRSWRLGQNSRKLFATSFRKYLGEYCSKQVLTKAITLALLPQPKFSNQWWQFDLPHWYHHVFHWTLGDWSRCLVCHITTDCHAHPTDSFPPVITSATNCPFLLCKTNAQAPIYYQNIDPSNPHHLYHAALYNSFSLWHNSTGIHEIHWTGWWKYDAAWPLRSWILWTLLMW